VTFRRGFSKSFMDAAEEVGIPRTDDFNSGDQEGAGYFQLTTRNGRRCSAAVGYLNPVKHRRNLEITTDATVRRIVFDGKRAVGVEFVVGGQIRTARVSPEGGELLLSCGAIASPAVLQHSGVGPGDLLRQFDIPMVHEAPCVGMNLQDHIAARSVYKTNEPSLNTEVNSVFGKIRIGLEYLLFRRGPLTIAAGHVGMFVKTRPELETPDVQFHIIPLSVTGIGAGLHDFPAFTASVCQLRPESRGHVAIKSPDPADAPGIHPNYFSTVMDQQTIVAGLKLSRKIMATPTMQALVTEEFQPGPDIQSDAELLEFARNTGSTVYHPVSTCKMGGDPMAVVDDRLKMHGLDALRVVDASVMPTLMSGNTNAPTIMIAEKAADMILADAR